MMTETKKKIGLLGGTFDPIHHGHLLIAQSALAQFELDKIIFIPTGDPPHKQNQKIRSTQDRYIMTLLATIDNPQFVVSRLEIDKESLSYTIDTVENFKQKFPKHRFYFITGADSILEITTWKQPKKLLETIEFIVAVRPGYSLSEMEAEIYSSYRDRIYSMDVPRLDISSTEIRRRVREGLPIKYQLPKKVESYIKKHGLYLGGSISDRRRSS